MTKQEHNKLLELCSIDKWHALSNVIKYLETLETTEELEAVKEQRTPQQNRTESTKDLATGQIDPIREVLERELGEKHGTEYISFPSDENKMQSARENPDFAEYYQNEDAEVRGLD